VATIVSAAACYLCAGAQFDVVVSWSSCAEPVVLVRLERIRQIRGEVDCSDDCHRLCPGDAKYAFPRYINTTVELISSCKLSIIEVLLKARRLAKNIVNYLCCRFKSS